MLEGNHIKIHTWLLPFSFLYGIGVRLRNTLFNCGMLRAEQYPVPVICIGNLTAGGTGKTPHTEYIVRLLRERYRVAILSRGYKRKTRGFVLATAQSSFRDIGDEPYQMKMKFPDILVAVDANRRRGIQKLLALPPEERPEVILLDDAYQYRYVTPSFSIVLTDFNRLYYLDKLLPAGKLCEPASGIFRTDAVVVTKCPGDLKPIECRIIEKDMHLFAHQLLYFTKVCYGKLTPVFPEVAPARELQEVGRELQEVGKEEQVLAIAGIANPDYFIKELEKYTAGITPFLFPDHHAFRKNDIKNIHKAFEQGEAPQKIILTTEKDAARLKDLAYLPESWKSCLYYLPIEIYFTPDKGFDEAIGRHIDNFIKQHTNSNDKKNRNS